MIYNEDIIEKAGTLHNEAQEVIALVGMLSSPNTAFQTKDTAKIIARVKEIATKYKWGISGWSGRKRPPRNRQDKALQEVP